MRPDQEPKDEKVFCFYCKYFMNGTTGEIPRGTCKHPENLFEIVDWFGKRKGHRQTPQDLNHTNDCTRYKEKE